jgi:pyranose oxidase
VGNSSTRCDVFIVGSGLLGSTFARLLVERGAQVVMADVGDFHSRRAGENRKNSWMNQRDLIQYGHFVRAQLHPVRRCGIDQAQEHDYPNPLVSYAVGGMAVHWTCAIPEFHERLERPPFIAAAEWRALYDRAAALLNRHLDVFHCSVRHRVIKTELRARGWPVEDTPMAAERTRGSEFVNYSGADTILGTLAEPGAHERFDIVAEHCVQRLVRSPGNEHVIDHAEIVDLKTGTRRRVYANTFVVAAGWLHTAQLLCTSALHTHHESALGRYFSDHTFAASTVLLKQSIIDAIAAEAGVEAGIPPRDAAPHLYIPVTDERPWQGMIFRESYQFEPVTGAADLRGIDLKWFGMIEPVRDNCVTFDRDRLDRLGLPAAIFRLRLSDKDRALQRNMMTDMQNVAACLGCYRPGAEPMLAPLGSAIHATGLTRMGPPEDAGETSVVDPWSQVWGIDNLYLGGTSVIPTPTAANPTFTAIALAIRAADKAAGRLAV